VGVIFIAHSFAMAFTFTLSSFKLFRHSPHSKSDSTKDNKKLNSMEHGLEDHHHSTCECVSKDNNSVKYFPFKEDDSDVSSQLQKLRTKLNQQLALMRQNNRRQMEVIETAKGQLEETQEHGIR
jgi:hypothetical protein